MNANSTARRAAPPASDRAVQPVPGPQLVARRRPRSGHRPSPVSGRPRGRSTPARAKMRLQRPQPRHAAPSPAASMISLDLRRGPLRPLPLQRERQLQHLGRRARRNHPRPGNQRFEPAAAIRADPVIQRAARDPDQPPVRPDMLPLGQRADQPAALSLRQTRVGRVPDQARTGTARSPGDAPPPSRSSQRSRHHERGTFSAHSAHGKAGTRVANSTPARQPRRDPPRIPGPNRNTHARASDRDRLQRVRDAAPSRQHRPELRIQRDRPPREMRPDQLSPLSEPAQPATNRVRRHPQPPSDPPIPLPGDARLDRRADHRHLILPPQQRQIRQQHMRARATPAPRPPRPQQPIPRPAAQHPLPRVPPRPQHPPTRRTRQAARRPAQPRPRASSAHTINIGCHLRHPREPSRRPPS